eukprot:TRINITY_DN96146_c0_g1_i1.p1 TRINITY_DN96146_c0_g1~~TRINITY_DN96146_c0_g1_i1.p1  ORF type:complete len:272 (-),score=51.27 TRINITY_DN96146_c0_g1_i1:83-814(-)
MKMVLQHYFPNWSIRYSRVASEVESQGTLKDWTTFFEYADAANTTSVFSIRGTDSALDALNDINIWLPAMLMQAFTLVGPWISEGMVKAIAFWSSLVHKVKPVQPELMSYVKKRLKEDPSRRFYITGHSLGGGLAKAVAAQVGIQAVTFMAPGLGWTGYMSLEQDLAKTLHDKALTLVPSGDVVSRIDVQVGNTVRVYCTGGPLYCHSIYSGGLCPLFATCGSMRRPGQPIHLPCGQCNSLPC